MDHPLSTLTAIRGLALANPTTTGALDASADDAFPGALEENGVDPRRLVFILVFIDGDRHLLDMRLRMLENRELARAMGFDDEEVQYEFHGNPGEVTRQTGTAVPVRLRRHWCVRPCRRGHRTNDANGPPVPITAGGIFRYTHCEGHITPPSALPGNVGSWPRPPLEWGIDRDNAKNAHPILTTGHSNPSG